MLRAFCGSQKITGKDSVCPEYEPVSKPVSLNVILLAFSITFYISFRLTDVFLSDFVCYRYIFFTLDVEKIIISSRLPYKSTSQ